MRAQDAEMGSSGNEAGKFEPEIKTQDPVTDSEKTGLPASLDKYYENTQPPEYLVKKFELGESLMGVIMNTQQGDLVNAKKSFKTFSQGYEDIADMVPEWKQYYVQKTVDNLGAALDTNNPPVILGAAGEILDNCAKCHKENMAALWNRYNWQNFNNVNINTPEGKLPWAAAKDEVSSYRI